MSNIEPSIHPRIPERVSVAVLELRSGEDQQATNCACTRQARKLTRVCGWHALSGDVTKIFLPDRRDCQSKNRSRSPHNTRPEDDGLFMCKVLLSGPSRVSASKSIQKLSHLQGICKSS